MFDFRSPALRGVSLLAIAAAALAACETTSSGDTAATAEVDVAPDSVGDGGASESFYPLTLGEAGVFAAFEPAPNGRTTNIDYEVISEALEIIVFDTGPSTRIRARDRQGTRAGSRIVKGHNSPYRLEGNKIFLSQFDDESGNSFREYAENLVDIGNKIDITTLPRNEQLAYWFNLHNMWVIAILADEYPVRYPERIKIDGALFHDAKIMNISGVDLSLSDIRTNIVYRYWDDPRVMYGFFHGDLGSPSIDDEAYTSENINRILDRNAREFVNALRGVQRGRSKVYISKLYYEARAGLFPNWPVDLLAHLENFADEEVSMILLENGANFEAMKYPNRTADMVGGDPSPDINAGPSGSSTPPQLVEMVQEVREKYVELRRQGRIGGARVIIIDEPTEDQGPPPDETID
ncbi:DUF547 domain-containing protein [Parvularcula marina]|uniref:DUF547 domain-containing protein n=1 Tax=Parvularcula marina TaxID=2292771 RepID=A0A371RKV6_9PROT|nr:DUF547 domain-containing protein [Parvularcula marina]RFB06102.1 DUF547 domain-containing protein [Parvularcula marina]